MSRPNSSSKIKRVGFDRAAYELGLAREVALACDIWLRKRGVRPGAVVTGREWLASQERASKQEANKSEDHEAM